MTCLMLILQTSKLIRQTSSMMHLDILKDSLSNRL